MREGAEERSIALLDGALVRDTSVPIASLISDGEMHAVVLLLASEERERAKAQQARIAQLEQQQEAMQGMLSGREEDQEQLVRTAKAQQPNRVNPPTLLSREIPDATPALAAAPSSPS